MPKKNEMPAKEMNKMMKSVEMGMKGSMMMSQKQMNKMMGTKKK